jgi:hypothetical protein
MPSHVVNCAHARSRGAFRARALKETSTVALLRSGRWCLKASATSMSRLFAGAISFCKNPSSYHGIDFDDPREVVDMISFANEPLRIVDRL